jgi:hypothetical protein
MLLKTQHLLKINDSILKIKFKKWNTYWV